VGEVSHEATKSTKEGEDGQGERHPPPLKLWRTGPPPLKLSRTGKAEGGSGGLTRSREGALPPLKLWRTRKAGRAEVSREEGGLTRSHEVHEGRGGWTRKKASAAAEAMADREGGPPPLDLWRTGQAEVMRSAFLSVALCRLVAAARGAPRRDGRALFIVEAAAARSAACEAKGGPGGGAGQ